MKKIIISTFVIGLLLTVYLANVNAFEIEIKTSDIDNIIEIRVARHSVEGTWWNIFEYILNEYEWVVGNKTYRISISMVTDNDIFKGKLTTENFDLLVMPYHDGILELEKRFYPSIRNKIWKTKITDFVKAGGGFVGYCAPTTLAADLNEKPKTLLSKIIDNFDLEISGVKLVYQPGLPILSQLTGKPEKIGQIAYLYYGGSYIPLNVAVNKDNPIFNDFLEDKRRISWCAGPAFEVPEPDETDHNITVLAYYPEQEISDNESTQIHAWKYTGGIRGLIKGFIKSKIGGFGGGIFPPALMGATDWKRTDKIVQTHCANKPFMTMETYPNENKGRVVLCGGHPEAMVFMGGHIEELEDTKRNNLFTYRFTDYLPLDETPEDEYTYNWWIVRRHVAWASKKVPDSDFPPVYGYSQVEDLISYDQSSCFTILGNMELSLPYTLYNLPYSAPSNFSLDLYYSYSEDNSSSNWSKWNLYETDVDGSDGWGWEFNTSDVNGSGFYRFYSIRKVEYHCDEEIYKVIETAPPGPDAIARVIE